MCHTKSPTSLKLPQSNTATRGKFQQVQLVNTHSVNTRDISESQSQTFILSIDDKRSLLLDSPSVPELTLTSPVGLAPVHTNNIRPDLVFLEEGNSILGFL